MSKPVGTIWEFTSHGGGFASTGPLRLSLAQRLKNHIRRVAIQLKRAASIFS